MATDIWARLMHIDKTLFTKSNKGQDIKVYFIDTVGLHEFNKNSREFFAQMASTEQLELFDLQLIQSIIKFKWPIVKKHVIKYSLLPHLFYLTATVLFTSNLLHDRLNGVDRKHYDRNDERWTWLYDSVVEEFMLVFASYFLSMELLQMRSDGVEYFKRIWNALDIVPCTTQIMLFILQLTGFFENVNGKGQNFMRHFFAVSMSLSSLFLWLKFLYFLRIFDSTGFLVRAIITVIAEMRFFLLILMVAFLAFGDSYKVMDHANVEHNQFLKNAGYDGLTGSVYYTYLIAMGEFDDDFGTVGSGFSTFLFIANTVFTTIISLNLFIAIISESFAKINEQDTRAKFREMADLITENEFLMSYESKKTWVKDGQYLLYVDESGAQDEDEMTTEQRTKNYVY